LKKPQDIILKGETFRSKYFGENIIISIAKTSRKQLLKSKEGQTATFFKNDTKYFRRNYL